MYLQPAMFYLKWYFYLDNVLKPLVVHLHCIFYLQPFILYIYIYMTYVFVTKTGTYCKEVFVIKVRKGIDSLFL